jgi:putative two-component system response regulator
LHQQPGFEELKEDGIIHLIYKSAPLHDIGKVGVPDSILLKPGPLTDKEWVEMRRHSEYGKSAIERAEEQLGTTTFLNIAKEMAFTHHERWDGTGYPQGLKGRDIPLSGRLMAIADVYDAIISKRVYKEAFSHQEAVSIILDSGGSQFDPGVTAAFDLQQDKFLAVAKQFSDPDCVLSV